MTYSVYRRRLTRYKDVAYPCRLSFIRILAHFEWSDPMIAKRLGISASHVYKLRKRAKIPPGVKQSYRSPLEFDSPVSRPKYPHRFDLEDTNEL